MLPEPRIHRYTPTVAELDSFIRRVIADCWPAAEAEALADLTCAPERLQRIAAERTWFAATRDGELLGVAEAHQDSPGAAGIGSMFVAERRAGIGQALTAAVIDHLIANADADGNHEIVAWVKPWNQPSLENLAKFGFVVVEEAPDGWLDCGTILKLVRVSL